jgi:hypothetical protein
VNPLVERGCNREKDEEGQRRARGRQKNINEMGHFGVVRGGGRDPRWREKVRDRWGRGEREIDL